MPPYVRICVVTNFIRLNEYTITKRFQSINHTSTFNFTGEFDPVNQLLPPVSSDEAGEAPLSGGRHQDPALDLYQVLPGPALRRSPHLDAVLHICRGRNAGELLTLFLWNI